MRKAMLFKDKVIVHNGCEYIETEAGLRISRVPLSAREKMTAAGKDVASVSWTGVELRFVIQNGDEAAVTVYNENPDPHWDANAYLYLGNFQYGWTYLCNFHLTPGLNRIPVKLPETMDTLRENAKKLGHIFSPDVVRLILGGAVFNLVDVEGDIRIPKAEELPAKTAVFYGSSITHGSLSMHPMTNYAALCGKKLGVDYLNKGMAGACFLEKEVIDYILGLDEAVFFSVEVATNCIGLGIPEIRRRTEYLANSFLGKYSDKHLFLIDRINVSCVPDECRAMIEDVVKRCNSNRVHYINGATLIPDFSFVTADCVHPTPDGHRRMADILSEIYKCAYGE